MPPPPWRLRWRSGASSGGRGGGSAAAAVAGAVALGVEFGEAVDRLADVRLSPWRMEVTEREFAGGSVVVVNDAYNANPDSMEAGLTTGAAVAGRPGAGPG